MEDLNEPLNLSVKKTKPIAVVAPIAPVENKNNNEQKNLFDLPQDLSIKIDKDKINNNYECLDLTTPSKFNKNEKHNFLKDDLNQQLKNYIEKSDFNNSVNNEKNIFNESSNDPKESLKNTYEKFYSSFSNSPEELSSVINSLAEQKFLTALYMNQILAQNLNFNYGLGYGSNLDSNILNNQSTPLLNNYFDKEKPASSKLFNKNDNKTIDSLIKNEVKNEYNKVSHSKRYVIFIIAFF